MPIRFSVFLRNPALLCSLLHSLTLSPPVLGQDAPPKLGEFPQIHFAVPDERVYRRFLAEQAAKAAELEKLPSEARFGIYASVGAKLHIRAVDAQRIMIESQKHVADEKREIARIDAQYSQRLGELQRTEVARQAEISKESEREKVQLRSKLALGTMKRIFDGLNPGVRNRLEASLLTQYDTKRPRPSIKEVVK